MTTSMGPADRFEHRVAQKDDPHTISAVTQSEFGFRSYHRECSCGWNSNSADRSVVMHDAKRHIAWVRYYRRMAKK